MRMRVAVIARNTKHILPKSYPKSPSLPKPICYHNAYHCQVPKLTKNPCHENQKSSFWQVKVSNKPYLISIYNFDIPSSQINYYGQQTATRPPSRKLHSYKSKTTTRRITNKNILILFVLLIVFCAMIKFYNAASAEEESDLKSALEEKIKKVYYYFKAEDYENAILLLDEMINNYSDYCPLEVYILKMNILQEREEFDAVIATYKHAKRNRIVNSLLYYYAGLAYYMLISSTDQVNEKAARKIIKYLSKAADGLEEQTKGVALALIGKYYFYFAKSELQTAHTYFKKALEFLEDDRARAQCFYHMGMILADKDPGESLDHLIAAVELDSNDTRMRVSLGAHLEKLKLYQQAIEYYDGWFSQASEPLALYLKAKLLYHLEYHEQVSLTIDLFLSVLNGTNSAANDISFKQYAYIMKARSLTLLGKEDDANQCMTEMKKIFGSGIEANVIEASLLLSQDKFDKAEEIIEDLINNIPQSSPISSYLACSHRFARACIYLQRYKKTMSELVEIQEKINQVGNLLDSADLKAQLTALQLQASTQKAKAIEDLDYVINNTTAKEDGLRARARQLSAQYQNSYHLNKEGVETPLHLAAKSGDITLLILSLEKYPIEARNHLYETALHQAAAMGHFEIVRKLVQLGGNINAPTVKKLPDSITIGPENVTYHTAIELAKENKHWGILEILLSARQKYTDQDLAPVDKYINDEISKDDLNILLFNSDVNTFPVHMTKYEAHLTSRSGTVFEAVPVNNKTRIDKVKLTGWDPLIFLTLRIMTFTELLKDVDQKLFLLGKMPSDVIFSSSSKDAKMLFDMMEMSKQLRKEILYALELRRSIKDAAIVSEVMADTTIEQSVRDKIQTAYIERIVREIKALQPEEQYPYLTGIFNHHYIYVHFGALYDGLATRGLKSYARIDNIGEAYENHSPIKDANGKTVIEPCVITFEDEKELRAYIGDLFTARFSSLEKSQVHNFFSTYRSDNAIKNRLYSLIYRKKCIQCNRSYIWPKKESAVGGHCAVNNYDIGMEIRLGTKLFNIIHKEEYRKLSGWNATTRINLSGLFNGSRNLDEEAFDYPAMRKFFKL